MNGPPTEQLTLPMRHGGLGLGHTGPEEGDAVYLSAVATTQLAMRRGPAEFRPFNGPSGAQLCLQWEGLHDKAETLWRPEDRVISQDSMGTIAEARRTVRVLAPASSAVPAAPHLPGWISSRSQEPSSSRAGSSRLPPTTPRPRHPAPQCPHRAVRLRSHLPPHGHRPRHAMLRPCRTLHVAP
jgi:hypothetical protein